MIGAFLALMVLLSACSSEPTPLENASLVQDSLDSLREEAKTVAETQALVALNNGSPHEFPNGWYAHLSGMIRNDIALQMNLWGKQSVVAGTLIYARSGKPIKILGQVSANDILSLSEFTREGEITGSMDFSLVDGKASGEWHKGGNSGNKALEFSATGKVERVPWPFVADEIAGEYAFKDESAAASRQLTVNLVGAAAQFSLSAAKGNSPQVKAAIDSVAAHVQGDSIVWNSGDCLGTIHFYDGFAVVRVQAGPQSCGFDPRGVLNGIYLKRKTVNSSVKGWASDL
jgi:hypothetical protein